MSKFFVLEEKEKKLLSEYAKEVEENIQKLKEEGEADVFIKEKETSLRELQYIISQIGDVEMTRSMWLEFSGLCHLHGGRYDVRSDSTTIKAIYEIMMKYPSLSPRAIGNIGSIYIKDLFDSYMLVPMLGKFIEVLGETDDCFELYYLYVEKKADELQKVYQEQASKLDEFKGEYSENYITLLKQLITRKHLSYDKICSSMPTADIVNKDEQQLLEIAITNRIHFSGTPISHQMTKTLATDGDMSVYPEQSTYYVSANGRVRQYQGTFTKQEFLDSINKQKTR